MASEEPAERGQEGTGGEGRASARLGNPQPRHHPEGKRAGRTCAHRRAPLHEGRRTEQNTPLSASSIHPGCTRQRRRLHWRTLARHRSLGAQRRLEQVDVHLFHTAAAVNGAISQRHLAQRSTRTVVASGAGARPLYQPPSSKAAKQAGGRSGGGPASQAHDSTWCNCNRRSGSTSSMPSSTSTSGGEKWHSRS